MRNQYRGKTDTEYHRELRQRRVAMGLCKHCSNRQHGGTQMCWEHRIYQAMWKYAKRQTAKLNQAKAH